MKNKKCIAFISTIILAISVVLGINSNINAVDTGTDNSIGVTYQTHVQNVGWQGWKKDGELAGTSGESLRLEAINIKLENADSIKIKYQTHVQNIGWQDWKYDGALAGTSGESLRLEAIKIELENSDDYSIAYRVHVQNIGWQDWKYDGELAGTSGESLRLEAIEIKIIKKISKGKIYVDTRLPNTYYNDEVIEISGWKMANIPNTKIKVFIDNKDDIVLDDNISYIQRQDVINAIKNFGTIKENPTPGFAFKLNSNDFETGEHTVKIILMTDENSTLETYINKFKIDRSIHVKYSTHVQNIGWQDYKLDKETAGTSGQSLRLEAIKIQGINFPEGMTIKYQTHIQNIGWQDWKSDGNLSGTFGQSLRLEAIKIKLEGTTEYSIRYRTHVEEVGWQDWCYDGESSGTSGKSLRLEAIEIQIIPKVTETKVKINIDNPATQISNIQQNIKGWIMTNTTNTSLQILIDNKEIDLSNLKRTEREDVINAIKGYGDETIYNKMPGFEIPIDFSKYSLGTHNIVVRVIQNGNVLNEKSKQFEIRKRITYSTGTYGKTGLKVSGDSRGTDLKYYQYGSGPNVFFATFAIHGFEDLWAKDGWELVEIANNFYSTLVNSNDYDLAEKWTIYIFPGVNMDGLNYGYTNNGPGRTTFYSAAPGNKGIDLNRCWQVGSSYTRATTSRNYNGTTGFQAYEAQYLRNFLLEKKSQNGQTVLVDLHGWTKQVIGDAGICNYYSQQFPENDRSAVGRYGDGYLINWARINLGSTSKTARSALIELPYDGIVNHQSVLNYNFSNRYIQATLAMLRGI